ncbi:GGDEF domain-containing protein [Erythrobacter sp. SDW2]|uniref:GGDEF domain-containing protein n=1 Tax=Erythrobacter sp. SDW2 TaxID=2907154 RepID=UPI001F455A4C|nr:diguanylate cyclase [Erythrobacter sp. SDW2]UIP07520.1 GGDEF domain-containing protein [Erythrobacter sp. SDW2]
MQAQSDGPRYPTCLANAEPQIPIRTLLAGPIDWHCTDDPGRLKQLTVNAEAERVLVRFSIAAGAEQPRYFVSRLGEFASLTLAVGEGGGNWQVRSLSTDDVKGMPTEPSIIARLPSTRQASGQYVVIIDRPSHAPLVINSQLQDSDPSQDPAVQHGLLLIAILLGMVLLPIVFDITFYRVLRETFLAWHIAMAASFGLLLSVRSGIINALFDISIETWRVLLIMGLTVSIGSAMMFMRSFIEPGKLSGWALRAIPWIAVGSIILTGLHALSIPALRDVSTTLHMIGVMVPYLMLTFVILQAAWRRSRAGLYVFIGWLPLMTSSWGGIVTNFMPGVRPDDMLTAFYIGMLTEMIATAMGVGDRFMTLKRERDVARAEVSELDELSNSDPLTGLLNRRAIDARFDELRAEGYDTFAVVDLDHFKRVNDTHGHDTGDAVLRTVASILSQCPQCLAFRFGGEEFLLLMKGDQSEARAEAVRQSIPVRIAREVDGLDHMVTASIGLVVVPQGALPNSGFADIYRHADRLLYEAKETGRNRMVSERVRSFRRRSSDRRAAA